MPLGGTMSLIRRLLIALLGSVALAGGFAVPPATADPLEKLKPDFELKPGQKATTSDTSVTVGNLYSGSPTDCRTGALPGGPGCKAYRLKLNRDQSGGALNFVVIRLDYAVQIEPPDLMAVAAGVNPFSVPNYNIYVYDVSDHYLGQNGTPGELAGTPAEGPVRDTPIVQDELGFLAAPGDPEDPRIGGIGLDPPDIAGFTAKQDEYDIVIANITGPGSGFELSIAFTNELFASPLEVLDSAADIAPVQDLSGPIDLGAAGALAIATPAAVQSLAATGVDTDFSGFGLGTRIDPSAFSDVSLPSGVRRTVRLGGAQPSGFSLMVWFVAAPLLLIGAGGLVMLRRRRAFA